MANLKYKISVVTVTYGNRWNFLSRVIQQLINTELVYHVIIVNNASAYDVQSKVSQLNSDKLIVINHLENEGSAAGYKAGIAYARQQPDTDFLLLLDDDNLPEENTFQNLADTWDELKPDCGKTALYCLRPDRKDHVKIARGQNPYRYYLVPDNFLGFNFFRMPYNRFLKLADKFRKDTALKKYAPIPYVPYGGLFFNIQLIDLIGYPDERYFLYVDDSEYTYRITQNGGSILLITNCIIHDIDQSIGSSYQHKLWHSHFLDQWNFRIYYHVRNRVYFYNKVAVKNQVIFNINKFIFMGWLKFISIISSKKSEYQKLKVAVSDGLTGNLGKANPNKL